MTSKPSVIGRPMEILLVEDDLDDAGLAIEVLKQGEVPCRVSLRARRRGGDAVHPPRGPLRPRPRPDVVLLDMQLPKKGGREVLSEIRQDKQLRRIPVVVLTSSETQWDVLKGENLFVEKLSDQALGPGAVQHRGQVAAEVPAGRRDRAAVSTRPPVSRTGFAKRHKDCGNGSCQRPPAALDSKDTPSRT